MNVLAKASGITTSVLAVAGRRRRPGSAGAHERCRGSAPGRSFRRPGRSLRRPGSGAAGRHRSGALYARTPIGGRASL